MSEVDLERLGLWAEQLKLDAGKQDAAAVRGDLFTLDYIRDRIMGSLDGSEVTRLHTVLEELQGATDDRDFEAAAAAAEELQDLSRSAAG